MPLQSLNLRDLIAASIHDEYLVGPSIRTICTIHCFTMTNMIQVCINLAATMEPDGWYELGWVLDTPVGGEGGQS